MALSEFSFELEFIAGVDNNIADAISRLCRNNMIDYPEEFSIFVLRITVLYERMFYNINSVFLYNQYFSLANYHNRR